MRAYLFCSVLCLASLGSAQTVRLQVKFPVGRTDRVVSASHIVETIGVPGTAQSMTIQMDQSMTMLMRVTRSDASGSTVTMTYEAIKSTQTMNGQAVPGSDAAEAAIKGKSLTLKFSPSGQLKQVIGLDALTETSMKNEAPQVRQMLKQLVNEKSIRDMFQMTFGGVYPNHPIRVGESWSASLSMGQTPFQIGMNLKMRLQGVERRAGAQMARLGVTGTGRMDMSGAAGMPGLKMKTDRFSITGTSFFNIDRGWMSDQNMTMQVHGTMSMPVQGKQQSSNLTMKMTSTTKVSPVK